MGIKKNPKGEISIENFRGRIRLRWRLAGERYSLNLPFSYLPENLHHATLKATEIKLDIAKGCFDSSLTKYNPIRSTPSIMKIEEVSVTKKAGKPPAYIKELVTLFNEWGGNVRNIDVDNTTYYLAARSFLIKNRNFQLEQLPQILNRENWSVSTYNERISLLKNFFSWLMDAEIITKNPLKDVRRKRNKRNKKNPRRIPLEEREIITLLAAIKHDTYCPSASRYKHSFYYPFLTFIFSTGVRNAEAVGLRVKHVDLVNKQVEISEAFARTVKGSNHAARIQKGTKTDTVRILPLSNELVSLLENQVSGKQPEDFVFPSPRGLSIDDRMLERRIVKPVMRKLGFGERDLYAARHSFGTRAVQQGMPLTEVAYLMGHGTIETASRNYVHVGKPALSLPAIGFSHSKEQQLNAAP